MTNSESNDKATSNQFALIHYCGHMISADERGRFPNSHESALHQAVDAFFEQHYTPAVFGSLAAGADILIAELAIKKGAELHLVFPYSIDTFIENSVLPSGNQWLVRFDSVLERADTITTLYQQSPKDEILSYAQCTEVAMGLGLLFAAKSDSIDKAKQLTLWDKNVTNGIAGTFPDMLRWHSLGLESFYFETKFNFNSERGTHQLPLTNFSNPALQQIPSQPPEMVAYQQQKRIASAIQPEAAFRLLQESSNDDSITWDLDRDVFGLDQNQETSTITNRGAGMLAFQLMKHSQNANHEKQLNDSFSGKLLDIFKSINNKRIKG